MSSSILFWNTSEKIQQNTSKIKIKSLQQFMEWTLKCAKANNKFGPIQGKFDFDTIKSKIG